MSRNILRRIRRDEMARDAEQRVIPTTVLPMGDRSFVRRSAPILRDWLRRTLRELNREIDIAVAVRQYDEVVTLIKAKLDFKAGVER